MAPPATPADYDRLLHFVDTRAEPGFPDQLQTLDQLRDLAPDASAADLAPARAVRDALARVVLDGPGDRALDQLCDDLSVRPRTDGPGRLAWRVDAPAALQELFADLVTAALQLWSTGDVERVRVCAATRCVVPFVDASPRHNRAFCSPRCATRTRVERHRRGHGSPPTPR